MDIFDIKKLETLSRLKVDDSEIPFLMADLKNIVVFKNKLDELDTDDILPLYQIANVTLGLRNDVVSNELSTSEALKNAPYNKGNYFKVPKVK